MNRRASDAIVISGVRVLAMIPPPGQSRDCRNGHARTEEQRRSMAESRDGRLGIASRARSSRQRYLRRVLPNQQRNCRSAQIEWESETFAGSDRPWHADAARQKVGHPASMWGIW